MSTQPSLSGGRLVGLDVVRSLALVGVVVMNFHGYLNGGAPETASLAERTFDPFIGPFSTRFAATFVTVAGIGVVLLTNRSRQSGDPLARSADRWRLVRRGVALATFGYVVDWIFAGTILFYYGAMFVVAAAIFTLRIRWLAVIAAASALVAPALQFWRIARERSGHSTNWLFDDGRWSADVARIRSPRALVFDIWVNGTHPLLPWLCFFCVGMILGRLLPEMPRYRRRLLLAGASMIAAGYGVATVFDRAFAGSEDGGAIYLARLGDTDPFSRMPLYLVTTLGSSLVAVLGIAWLGDRFAATKPVDVLRRAGQTTLTLYTLHVLVFNLAVTWLGVIQPVGLDGALVFALGFWAYAIAFGAWWHRFVGRGPLEELYRRFGG